IGADRWLVAAKTSGPFTTSTAIPASIAKDVATIDAGTRADAIVLLHSTLTQPTLKDVNVIGYDLTGIGAPPVTSGRKPRAPHETVADVALGLQLGQHVDLGGQRLTVVGLATGITYYFGTPTLFIPLADAQRIAFGGRPLAMAIVTRGVPHTVPAGLRVMSNDQVASDLLRPLKSGTQSIYFIDVLLWIVAAGIIGSIVYLSALERTRDFAVLKATGSTNGSLMVGLAVQAALLSLVSVAVAIVFAKLLAPIFPFAVEITLTQIFDLTLVSLAVGLFASLAGLRRAVAVDPALAFGGA
ncbi:MAG: ABC transporter permease, partial [Actinomycetota bacterium]|nr:ABC transporter permease [Actinomycetota bacterium]